MYSRSGVHGLMISASSYTEPAIEECRRALTQRVIVLAELPELLLILERGSDLAGWLKTKSHAAAVDQNPLSRPTIEASTGCFTACQD